ncbi:RNA-directed DNA polymerase from mobile element jockey [Merluccius polli]|uniref:RNA-directed DNA polymerase from mobile element jockey n=1 Tax=Merluccius polli TaxID=89951 RepID=A0AA47MKU2_MERPO|nr:RNA-directed DNA polymerase from mobile element jockey [Merluccius polli]
MATDFIVMFRHKKLGVARYKYRSYSPLMGNVKGLKQSSTKVSSCVPQTSSATRVFLRGAYFGRLPVPSLVICQRVEVDKVCLGLRSGRAEHQTVLPPLHLLHLDRNRKTSTRGRMCIFPVRLSLTEATIRQVPQRMTCRSAHLCSWVFPFLTLNTPFSRVRSCWSTSFQFDSGAAHQQKALWSISVCLALTQRRRRRGKRGGVHARLTANPQKLAVPTLLLANVRSIDNKLDYIRLWRASQRNVRNCCVSVFTETWLSENIADAGVQLEGLILHRADRVASLTGKQRGGGLAVYINKSWCQDSVVVSTLCSSNIEFMTVKCRPFYTPRELTAVIVTAVYVPPSANCKEAMAELYTNISETQTDHPDAFFIIAGDFNQASLKSVMPKFYQHVNIATRGENTLDLVYTNIKDSYRAAPLPHVGSSDHLAVMLTPAYKPRVKQERPVVSEIRKWPQEAITALQDCFESTQWDIFREAATYENAIDLQEYTESVIGYINKCIDDVTVVKTIKRRANQKPWLTEEVCSLLRARNAAFKAGDTAAYSVARKYLSRGIREAKRLYAQKLNSHFMSDKDPRRLWQGFQNLTDYKPLPLRTCHSDPSLPNELNDFYARFEVNSIIPAQTLPPSPTDQVLQVSTAEVKRVLASVNPRKAAGPDNIPGRVLKDCAEQLSDVFTDIFNTSLSQAAVPTCLKSATIIPVPKKSKPACLNDFRPVALTPIIMKCFERLVMRHIKNCLPANLDPLQFAYRTNRSTEDAIATTLHLTLSHLERKNTYARILLIDFSSAFNTLIPQQLVEKLKMLQVDTGICNWILDFLTQRRQAVKVGSQTSRTISVSTGSPQGCVLSPLLFSLLTHDCAARHSTNHIIKYADDSTVVGLISDNDESAYRIEVELLTAWCESHNLVLNVDKTKEMVIDFRRGGRQHAPINIHGSAVERVSNVKFLGVHLADDLTFSTNTTAVIKKAQRRLHPLRRLRKAGLPTPHLTTFYRGTIESILTYGFTSWFGSCKAYEQQQLNRIVKTASRIIGASLPFLKEIYEQRCTHRAAAIIRDFHHPSHGLFSLLPSGKRYRSISCRTTRMLNSFFAQAVRLVNGLRSLPTHTPTHTHTHTTPNPPARRSVGQSSCI